jgi:SH3-like domain-containing protein
MITSKNRSGDDMKKSVIAASLVLLLLHLSCSAEALCVIVPKANIRSGPGTQYEVIWQVYKYMPFERAGKSAAGGWYAVKDVDGDVNWISKKLVTNSFRCAVVKKARVNVRKGPGVRYGKSRWGPAEKYSSLRVLQRKGSWVRVKNEWGDVGWVHKSYLWIK